jgi:hypothetical protein
MTSWENNVSLQLQFSVFHLQFGTSDVTRGPSIRNVALHTAIWRRQAGWQRGADGGVEVWVKGLLHFTIPRFISPHTLLPNTQGACSKSVGPRDKGKWRGITFTATDILFRLECLVI